MVELSFKESKEATKTLTILDGETGSQVSLAADGMEASSSRE